MSEYIHGTDPGEQKRLSLLNDLLNEPWLEQMAIRPGERMLDVGSGLGQLSRGIARRAGSRELEFAISNILDIMRGARGAMLGAGLIGAAEFEGAVAALRAWQERPDAACWYRLCWAEGHAPA